MGFKAARKYSTTLSLLFFMSACSTTTSRQFVAQTDPQSRQRRPSSAAQSKLDPYYFDSSPEAIASCEEFFHALRTTKPSPKTVLEALKLLKTIKPKYFSYYSLMHRSLSLHGSSQTHPRALVFGGDGRMVVSFNGHPSQAGYERLEVMCFNEKSDSFEFRDVAFPAEAQQPPSDLNEKEKKRPFVISPSGGTKARDCRMCHLEPSRPIWDTYSIWPGAYGAENDHLFVDLPPSSTYEVAEAKAWSSFSYTGRYDILNPIPRGLRPNLRLGKALVRWNARHIVSQLKALGARFEKIKAPFAQSLFCPLEGVRLVNGVPAPAGGHNESLIKDLHESIGYFRSKQIRLANDFDLQEFPRRGRDKELAAHYSSLGFSADEIPYVDLLAVDDLIRIGEIKKLVGPLGLDTRKWSLVLHGGNEFVDGNGDYSSQLTGQIREPFLETFFSEDKTLLQLIRDLDSISTSENPESAFSKSLPPEALYDKIKRAQKRICEHLDGVSHAE